MGSTLPIPSSSACKVQVSSVAQRQHYPPHFLPPTSQSCTDFFKTYILRAWETDSVIPQPDWTILLLILDSFGYSAGMWKPSSVLADMPNSKKFFSHYLKVSTVFRRLNRPTLTFSNYLMYTYICQELMMIPMQVWDSQSQFPFFPSYATFTHGALE